MPDFSTFLYSSRCLGGQSSLSHCRVVRFRKGRVWVLQTEKIRESMIQIGAHASGEDAFRRGFRLLAADQRGHLHFDAARTYHVGHYGANFNRSSTHFPHRRRVSCPQDVPQQISLRFLK